MKTRTQRATLRGSLVKGGGDLSLFPKIVLAPVDRSGNTFKKVFNVFEDIYPFGRFSTWHTLSLTRNGKSQKKMNPNEGREKLWREGINTFPLSLHGKFLFS
jgi:hypothetical protein